MKYNTVRWIVNKYKQNSRVNIKKKISGYSKRGKVGANNDDDVDIDQQTIQTSVLREDGPTINDKLKQDTPS